MTQDWESRFRAWIAGPSQTEETRSENAIRGITNAITSSDALRRRSIKVFVQGSYRNHVNVRQDSDVDVGVMLYSDSFFANYPAGKSASDFGNSRSGYSYSQFKSDLCDALIRRFGSKLVTRANKAIKVRANSYHVEADVAPFLEHREYQNDRTYYGGVQLNPDRGGEILNYPEHLLPSSWRYRNGHYENGRDKNSATSRRFKRVVRILKKLRIGMENAGFPSASTIPGYLLECMGLECSKLSLLRGLVV